MKVFLINLDRRPDRLAEMTERLNALGLEFERVSAFDGTMRPTLHLVAWVKAIIFNNLRLPSAGVIGCYQSHRIVWQRMVDEEILQALIFEDDVLPGDWNSAILNVEIADHGLDLLRLEAIDFNLKTPLPVGTDFLDSKFYIAQTSGAAAYIITNVGARKCLSLGKFWVPLDAYDVVSKLTGLKTAIVIPAMWKQSGSVSDLRAPTHLPSTKFENVVSIFADVLWRMRRPVLRAARRVLVEFEAWKGGLD